MILPKILKHAAVKRGFVAQRFHNYMILKVLIVFDPKLNLFKSDAYIFMQQSRLFATVPFFLCTWHVPSGLI